MDQNPKQQVAEKLRNSANVLVTVSKNPSVDQLAAAIGLSLMLDALGKHTATVFSGQIPDILSFLEPENTFDDSVDSLRDFIISLDKDKADKLRYKVEDDVVRIYITPYRSKITEADLDFAQGDFNVDVVMALGVKKKADLDEAITAHGRILHDATVVAVNAGEVGGDVGAIDWIDPNANSLCEMLVSISEALEGGILDPAMSTAFLTGIVSVTERFSNANTTPKLMTMAAQLMAAGANQQLISKELQLGDLSGSADGASKDGSTLKLHEKNSSKKSESKIKEIKENIKDDIKLDELEKQLQEAEESDDQEPAKEVVPTDLPKVDEPMELPIVESRANQPVDDTPSNPSLGGTFNATSEEALQAKLNEHKTGFNDEILTHNVQPLTTDASVEEARRAVEQAALQTPFNPAGNPIESLNAQPMSNDMSQQLSHDQAPMIQPLPPQAPPPAPPPLPPQMPQMMPGQPPMPAMPQPMPAPAPMTNPAFDMQIPPQQPMAPPQPQPYPPIQGMPPAPVDNGQLPPPPPPQ